MQDTLTDIYNTNQNSNNKESILSIDELMNSNKEVNQSVPVTNTSKKIDKILMIQITLLVVWAILTTLVYFFGYSLFEPFIKV